MRLRKPDYKKEGKELIKDILKVIKYYEKKTNPFIKGHFIYYNDYKYKRYIAKLKEDLELQQEYFDFINKRIKK